MISIAQKNLPSPDELLRERLREKLVHLSSDVWDWAELPIVNKQTIASRFSNSLLHTSVRGASFQGYTWVPMETLVSSTSSTSPLWASTNYDRFYDYQVGSSIEAGSIWVSLDPCLTSSLSTRASKPYTWADISPSLLPTKEVSCDEFPKAARWEVHTGIDVESHSPSGSSDLNSLDGLSQYENFFNTKVPYEADSLSRIVGTTTLLNDLSAVRTVHVSDPGFLALYEEYSCIYSQLRFQPNAWLRGFKAFQEECDKVIGSEKPQDFCTHDARVAEKLRDGIARRAADEFHWRLIEQKVEATVVAH